MISYTFWRPILFSLTIAGLVALICCWLGTRPILDADDYDVFQLSGLTLPEPRFTPREVVQTQLNGMRDRTEVGLGLMQCYCFASPSNRVVTGPFPRFAQMVVLPPYDHLVNSTAVCVGEAIVAGDQSRVVVSAVDAERDVHVYVFALELQHESPFTDCWMTSGVFGMRREGRTEPSDPLYEARNRFSEKKHATSVRLGTY